MKTWLEKLQKALASIDRPGSFCCRGVAAPVIPGLQIEGIGPVALPLTETAANELKRHCEQAGYGKGTQTVVDTDVRRVWRLSPKRFRVANPAWQDALQEMIARTETELEQRTKVS